MNDWKFSVVYSNEKAAIKAANADDPAMIVFNKLLASLFEALERSQKNFGSKAKFTLFTHVSKIKLPMKLHRVLREYLLHDKPIDISNIALNERLMHQIIQVLYEMMCDVLGPTQADACMSAAMQATRKIPESAFFDPRNLL